MRRCRGCGQPTPFARCLECERIYQRKRNVQLKRKAYRDPNYLAIPLVGVCQDCGSAVDLTRHHERAVRYGGSVADGIVILCRTCNSRRQ